MPESLGPGIPIPRARSGARRPPDGEGFDGRAPAGYAALVTSSPPRRAPSRPFASALTTAAGLALATVLAATTGLVIACDKAPRALCGPEAPCPTASAVACAAGPEGRLYGRTTVVDGTCAATDDAACRASTVSCPLWGQCSAPTSAASGPCPGAADPEHERDHLASATPACGAGHTCVATKDADCRAATVCRTEGRCVARGGACVAADPADCKAATLCRDLGWCALAGDRCTAVAPADCRQSEACDDWGECGVAAGGIGCIACDRSEDCRVEGRCERVLSTDSCQATRPEHCRAAAVCRTEGRCLAAQGVCVKGGSAGGDRAGSGAGAGPRPRPAGDD